MVEVELTHLLAYNMITQTPVNIDAGGLSSPNCRKAWEICPGLWVTQRADARKSQNTRLCHICGLCVLQLITDFYLHLCEVNDYLGLGSELSALDPWFHWARSLPTIWLEAFVFSTRRIAPCFHRNSALRQCHCCGCMAEPTGWRCFSPHWKCHRSFRLSLQIFQSCSGPPWSLKTGFTDYHVGTDY